MKKIVLCLIALTCLMATSAYAGRVELTTYYPAPYGEYQNLKIGNGATPPTTPGVINFEPIAPPAGGNPGDLYFDSTAPGQFKYYDNGSISRAFGGITYQTASDLPIVAMGPAATWSSRLGLDLSQTGTWLIEVSFDYSGSAYFSWNLCSSTVSPCPAASVILGITGVPTTANQYLSSASYYTTHSAHGIYTFANMANNQLRLNMRPIALGDLRKNVRITAIKIG